MAYDQRSCCNCRGESTRSEFTVTEVVMSDLLDFSVTIDGFPRHSVVLNATQLDRLDTLAFYVVSSQAVFDHRVFLVDFVGHADSESPKKPEFEQDISEKRASATQDALWQLKDKWAVKFNQEIAFRASLIFHTESGVGATEPHPMNAGSGKPSVVNHALNRRVVITFSHTEKLPKPVPLPGGPAWQWPPSIPLPDPDKPPGLPWWKLPPNDSKKSENPFDIKLPQLRSGDWVFKPDFDPIWTTLKELKNRLKL